MRPAAAALACPGPTQRHRHNRRPARGAGILKNADRMRTALVLDRYAAMLAELPGD